MGTVKGLDDMTESDEWNVEEEAMDDTDVPFSKVAQETLGAELLPQMTGTYKVDVVSKSSDGGLEAGNDAEDVWAFDDEGNHWEASEDPNCFI